LGLSVLPWLEPHETLVGLKAAGPCIQLSSWLGLLLGNPPLL